MTEPLKVEVEITGQPVPKGRPRLGANGHTYTPERTRNAEHALAWRLREAMAGRPPTTRPVRVGVEFDGARANADLDNLVKLVLDAANGIIYADDRQVRSISGGTRPEARPKRTRVWFEEIP